MAKAKVKPKTLLLGLIALGVVLHFLAYYTAFHPHLMISKVAITLLFLYLLAVPIVLLLMRAERRLRLVIAGIYTTYILTLCLAIYRMIQD